MVARPTTPAGVVSLATHQTARGTGTTSLSERAYQQLRRQILTLELAPGRSFTENEIAEQLDLSKTPVRDALARLRRDGLVESAPRSGYRVTPVTVKDARDLFGLRTILEGEAAALAAERGGDTGQLRTLDQLCQAQQQPTDPAGVAAFLDANADFHLAVARLGGNTRLTDALQDCIDQLSRYLQLGLGLDAAEIVHDHGELLAAIVTRDVETARSIATAQSQRSHRVVLEGLLNSDAVLSTNLAHVPDVR